MEARNITFIDEAGNTGYDIWSKDQPYFVMAAVTFPKNKMHDVDDYVSAEFNANKEIGELELKGNKWARAGRNKGKALLKILSFVCEHAVDIHLIILEKRYMTAGLICQYFLDPEYSTIKVTYWMNNQEARLASANYFYGLLNENEAARVALSILKPTTESLKETRDTLLGKVDVPPIKEMIRGTKNFLEKMASDLSSIDRDGLRKNVVMSPNYTVFITLGSQVAMLLKRSQEMSNMVFDRAKMCNEEFESLFNLASSWPSENDILLEELVGHTSWSGAFVDFSTSDSKKSNGVVCADVVSSSIAHILKRKDAEKLTEAEKGIWDFYRKLEGEGKVFWVASHQLVEQLF